ncbi:hypothetical protein EUX98_g5749 [Antrodiella citrinella]|uniref:Uncharacterized protein n=1 Tax=Antrodiella citrinella TaxID=2447956 RepID=A0A4S4MSL2_9APHY|nr:hypothetical protein EUX98_g5749 [Antrodiella citrinella]
MPRPGAPACCGKPVYFHGNPQLRFAVLLPAGSMVTPLKADRDVTRALYEEAPCKLLLIWFEIFHA